MILGRSRRPNNLFLGAFLLPAVSGTIKVFSLLMALAAFFTSCSDDDGLLNTPHILRYKGTYMWRNVNLVINTAKIDSIDFTITDGTTYSMKFYALSPSDVVDFCDCDGEIGINTGDIMSFEPSVIAASQCDKFRIPSGEFTADYFGHRPDTVYFDQWEIEETTQDSLLSRLIVLPQ